ncbi:hypothetical protein SLS60_005302 [Paraconiothyrium brasiliense]|uniref:Transposase n=1 Tax=Paraconiothyrium brasiliense TaxID=300254 RepID=A0ABR3RH93_9PLEO
MAIQEYQNGTFFLPKVLSDLTPDLLTHGSLAARHRQRKSIGGNFRISKARRLSSRQSICYLLVAESDELRKPRVRIIFVGRLEMAPDGEDCKLLHADRQAFIGANPDCMVEEFGPGRWCVSVTHARLAVIEPNPQWENA